ncbi:MAG TPA: hypothetical protein VHC49_13095 [Mycobacteriales bacterium]|nr:hypothetical protein [Mycobacteriales bacterium]
MRSRRDPVRYRPPWRLGYLPGCLAASAAVAVIGIAIAWPVRDRGTALSVLGGVAMVVVFFSISAVVLAWVTREAPQLSMLVALLTYTVKILAFALIMRAISDTSVRTGAFALAIAAGIVAWIGMQLWYALRH